MNAVSASLPLLSGLSARERRAVVEAAHLRTLVQAQTLFHEGDPAESVFMLAEGVMRLWRCSAVGAASTIDVLVAGDLPGGFAALRSTPWRGSATALAPCRLLVWPAEAMRGFMRAHPAIALAALELLGRRADALDERLYRQLTESVGPRVARALLDLGAGGREFRAYRQDVAGLAGTTVHSASRLISRWAREGLLRAGRGRIALVDPSRLAAMAENGS